MARLRIWPAVLSLVLLFSSVKSLAVEYQWSTTVDTVASPETGDYARAFLWIPPACDRVRAVVIGQHNMEEEPILEHPAMRQALGQLCFAEVWVTPAMGEHPGRFDRPTASLLEPMLVRLAEQSGYTELAHAPLVPLGHSAMAGFGWDVARWKPGRVLAILSISGNWPYLRDANSGDWSDARIDGIPALTVKGEYEIKGSLTKGWYAGLKGNSLKEHPQVVFTQVVEPGGGHFEVSDDKIALLSLFLRKAAQYRLPDPAPAGGPPLLRPIDPQREGWLYDVWRRDTPASAPAAPVADYRGNRDEAYWAFDAEMAAAIAAFQSRFRNQAPVLLGYAQHDGLTRPTPDHAMVHLKFEPMEDGLTFRLRGDFWDRVPGDGKVNPGNGQEGTSEWGNWLDGGAGTVRADTPVAHPATWQAGELSIRRICGPVIQTAVDTFAIRFDRAGTINKKRSNDIWFALTWPGDGQYKPMVQQAELRFPLTNREGQAQTLTFAGIADQPARAAMPPLQLNATSSAGVPVHYYVREGPAEVSEQGVLTFAAMPPRSKYPIRVTVVAWQWGRSIAPMMKSAEPVERSFLITAATMAR